MGGRDLIALDLVKSLSAEGVEFSTDGIRIRWRNGDGLVTALQLLAVVVGLERPVSEVCARFERLPQVLKNVRYENGQPLDDERVRKVIEDARGRLGANGRLVIRPSGTESVIRVMAEGDDEVLVSDVVGDIVEAVKRVAA